MICITLFMQHASQKKASEYVETPEGAGGRNRQTEEETTAVGRGNNERDERW